MNSCLGVCPNSLICSSMAARSSGSRILVVEREGERVGWRGGRERGTDKGEGRREKGGLVAYLSCLTVPSYVR